MAKTKYKKKKRRDKEYYFYRLYHPLLTSPKDIFGSTVEELEKKIKKIQDDLDNGIKGENERVGIFLEDYIFKIHSIGKKPSTMERYESFWRLFIKPHKMMNMKIRDLTLRDLQAFYNDIANEISPRTGKPNSLSTIKGIKKIISPAIRYAYINGLVSKDFGNYITLPDASSKLSKKNTIKAFTVQEEEIFIEAVRGDENESLFLTALFTGMRRGELLALTWDDVNFEKKYIEINKNVRLCFDVTAEGRGKGHYVVQKPKTESSIRRVPLDDLLVPILKQQRIKNKEARLMMAELWEENNLLFPNTFGRHKDGSRVLKQYKRVLKRIGLEGKYDFHCLRHTFATRCFEQGIGVKTVSDLLGHSSSAVTLETYTWVLDDLKTEAVNKVSLAFEKSLSAR